GRVGVTRHPSSSPDFFTDRAAQVPFAVPVFRLVAREQFGKLVSPPSPTLARRIDHLNLLQVDDAADRDVAYLGELAGDQHRHAAAPPLYLRGSRHRTSWDDIN